jgi:hypothetical protein
MNPCILHSIWKSNMRTTKSMLNNISASHNISHNENIYIPHDASTLKVNRRDFTKPTSTQTELV